ncbi:hypothetical protein [Cryptosporangium arvum]|uniref:Serine/threonine protein kinase n=1 Tax=Cryptosporangium arvum DSM 44712 TaxID=927661 RepID=A0A010YI86_9ACTN|nr:hypothetical protein [Cryptosporangium arvum]EXG79985.1 hypothetical protein CryarDRAFT_1040 [Cryptosporangium arvum DSM 44712]
MSHRGPLLTLLSGAVVAAVLLGLSTQANTESTQQTAARAPSQSTPPAKASPSAAAPPPIASSSKPPTENRKAVFAGRVVGGRATVAISVKDGQAVAYYCDGDRTEAWMRGPASGGDLDLKGAPGGTLTGTFSRTKAAGTVTAGGRDYKFEAPLVKSPAGVYRGTVTIQGAKLVAGWIVLPDGTQVGVFTTDEGNPRPAPKIDLGSKTATVDGGTMTVTEADPKA